MRQKHRDMLPGFFHDVVALVAPYAVKCFETEKIGVFDKIRWFLRVKLF